MPVGASGQTAVSSIYGTIRRDRPPLEGLIVSVACPSFTAAGGPPRATGNGVADARGSYSVVIAPATRGRCELRIASEGKLGQPTTIFVSDSAQRYDLVVDAGLGVMVR
jgi:hypothetical protein